MEIKEQSNLKCKCLDDIKSISQNSVTFISAVLLRKLRLGEALPRVSAFTFSKNTCNKNKNRRQGVALPPVSSLLS